MAHVFNTNLPGVAVGLARSLLLKIAPGTLSERLQTHPDYPSLFSLSETFERFKIENAAYVVTEADLPGLPVPFVAYLNNLPSGNDFVLVKKVTPTAITLSLDGKKAQRFTREKFMKHWQKIVWLIEPSAESGDKNYAAALKKENKQTRSRRMVQWAGTGTALLLMAQLLAGVSASMIPLAVALLLGTLLGLIVTLALLAMEIGHSNNLVKNICSASPRFNCDAVLHSRGSRIAGISWAELGAIYFAGLFILLLLTPLSFAAKVPLAALATITALPYIPFSLYYQYKVVRQWCPLCLLTLSVLVINAVSLGIFYLKNGLHHWSDPIAALSPAVLLSSAAICILLPATIWFLVKPLLQKSRSTNDYKYAYQRLLYNPEYFAFLLQSSASAPDGWQHLGITIGNPNAETTIIKVCNPYCGPCAKAHPVLEEIIKHNHQINLKIIFTATPNENDPAALPVKHFLAIAEKNEPGLTEAALDTWYGAKEKDYAAFAKQFPADGSLDRQGEKLEAMAAWCKEAGIQFTPTLFINGKQLPENYRIEELRNIF